MKFFNIILSLFLLSNFATPLLAQGVLSLDIAKNSGLVGEKLDGYLGIVTSSSPELSVLVEDVNAKRRAKYLEISKENGTALSAVEKLAASQAIEKTLSGNYIESAPGSWKKK